MPKKKAIPEPPAMALLIFARQYHRAAEHLFDLRGTLGEPVHFLYFHTMELALKAFLRSFNKPIPWDHELTELYDECRTNGLVIGPSDQFDIRNVAALLETGNKYQGFRYFVSASKTTPDLGWTREVVKELMRVVEERLEVYSKQDPTSKAPRRFNLIFGKPVPQN